jgi:5-deoxy-D-glucuronate isomerase
MTFVIYKANDKRVVKKVNSPYEAEDFLEEHKYHKRTILSGFFYPMKSLDELNMIVASIHDIDIIKRHGHEYVVKHGHETYALPPVEAGNILKKVIFFWKELKRWKKRQPRSV